MARRQIKIRMSPRVAKDSPEILTNVAKAFQKDDIDIDISDASKSTDELVPVPFDEEKAGLDIAKTTLDLEDAAIRRGEVEPPTTKKAKGRFREFRNMLAKEGARATAIAVIREVIHELFTSGGS